MPFHPFQPIIFQETKKLLIGSLPPETAPYYFSNSSNTRLWDILKSIRIGSSEISYGSNGLTNHEKHDILQTLNLGLTDIIYEYERENYLSTDDKHIIPISYKDLFALIENSNIKEFIFVYQSAFKWFLHSLTNKTPVQLNSLNGKFEIGFLGNKEINNKKIGCYLVPSPLNRGRRGETLEFKIQFYKKIILGSD